MYRPGGTGPRARGSILGALKATEMLDSRSRLPAGKIRREDLLPLVGHDPIGAQWQLTGLL
jgi:hypothetical protein